MWRQLGGAVGLFGGWLVLCCVMMRLWCLVELLLAGQFKGVADVPPALSRPKVEVNHALAILLLNQHALHL